MPWIATTQKAGTSFGNTGKFFYMDPAANSVEVALPSGVNAVDARPSWAAMNADGHSRMYGVGGWTDNLVFTENFQLMRQGILPPTNQIVNAAGAGNKVGVQTSGTGVTGQAICYIRWWDDNNQRRSPLSGASPTITLTNQGRAWSNLPTNPRDLSVTHIEGWVSMDGDFARLAWRRDLGTTAVTENLATGLLGEPETDDFTRFPRTKWNVFWHDRQATAGDARHPDRLYLSPLNEPERYGGLYLRTRKGEAIVGLISMRDQLVVLCARSSYVVTGYTEDDLAMNILEPEIGCIGHHLVAMVHGWAIVPTHLGIYLCTGSAFHFISKDFQYTWLKEFADHESNYEDAWAVNDIEGGVYKLYVATQHSLSPRPDTLNHYTYWILDYSKLIVEVGGNFQQPDLSLDVRMRADECAAILKRPDGKRGALYTGSCDGMIRRENVAGANDDGDEFDKQLMIMSKHYYLDPDGPGGTPQEGFDWATAWEHVVAPFNSFDVFHIGGEDYAGDADRSDIDPFTVGVDDDGGDLTAVALHFWEPQVAGRGFTKILVMDSPGLQVEWNGFGGTRFPGTNERLPLDTGVLG